MQQGRELKVEASLLVLRTASAVGAAPSDNSSTEFGAPLFSPTTDPVVVDVPPSVTTKYALFHCLVSAQSSRASTLVRLSNVISGATKGRVALCLLFALIP